MPDTCSWHQQRNASLNAGRKQQSQRGWATYLRSHSQQGQSRNGKPLDSFDAPQELPTLAGEYVIFPSRGDTWAVIKGTLLCEEAGRPTEMQHTGGPVMVSGFDHLSPFVPLSKHKGQRRAVVADRAPQMYQQVNHSATWAASRGP